MRDEKRRGDDRSPESDSPFDEDMGSSGGAQQVQAAGLTRCETCAHAPDGPISALEDRTMAGGQGAQTTAGTK